MPILACFKLTFVLFDASLSISERSMALTNIIACELLWKLSYNSSSSFNKILILGQYIRRGQHLGIFQQMQKYWEKYKLYLLPF